MLLRVGQLHFMRALVLLLHRKNKYMLGGFIPGGAGFALPPTRPYGDNCSLPFALSLSRYSSPPSAHRSNALRIPIVTPVRRHCVVVQVVGTSPARRRSQRGATGRTPQRTVDGRCKRGRRPTVRLGVGPSAAKLSQAGRQPARGRGGEGCLSIEVMRANAPLPGLKPRVRRSGCVVEDQTAPLGSLHCQGRVAYAFLIIS